MRIKKIAGPADDPGIGSKIKKKPPSAIILGNESPRWRNGAAEPPRAEIRACLHVEAFTMDGASLDPRHFAGVCLVTLSACAWAASGGVSKSPPRLPSRVLFV